MKRLLSLFVTLMVFASTVKAYEISEWATEEITKANELGIITEKLNDADLKEDITREEFAEVVVKTYEKLSKIKLDNVSENPFSDTENQEILKAYNLGIIKGVAADKFSPDALLSREAAAVMLHRVYEKIMTSTISPDFSYSSENKFADDDKISDWAKSAVYFMADNGIISGVGDNKFAPKNITEEEKNEGYANTTREQAVILAKRMMESEFFKDKMGGDIDPYGSAQQDELSKEENTYTVGFIGGSLTEGGHSWISATVDYLQEKMPDKKVQFLNAGKGGTTSNYGAARFMNDIGNYEPDMVFIEFAVNDSSASRSEDDSKIYMESMVRMCANMKKVPVVIFLYTPHPVETDTEEYKKWAEGVKWKEQIAKHYGLKSINIYEYMQEDFKNQKDEKGYETFSDYLAPMYSKTATGFDVHGGYGKYSEAILKAFKEDYEGCFTKPSKDKTVFCSNFKNLVNARYDYIEPDSKRMKYTGEWSTYTFDNQFKDTTSGISINSKHYLYPYFEHGIKQSQNQASGFGFMTKANEFCVNYVSASAGNSAKVYVDMVEVGTSSCYSSIHGMNYNGGWITLPDDGKEHKVIIIVDDATATNYVYRFGNVIERYWGK